MFRVELNDKGYAGPKDSQEKKIELPAWWGICFFCASTVPTHLSRVTRPRRGEVNILTLARIAPKRAQERLQKQ